MSWLPSAVALNCIDDFAMKQDHFSGVAAVEHIPLSHLADGRIDSASAVVLQSFAYLPRAAQRQLRPYQLILCLGSGDCATDSTFTADLGCQSPKHFDGRISGVYGYEDDAKCGMPTWICKGLTYFLICRPGLLLSLSFSSSPWMLRKGILAAGESVATWSSCCALSIYRAGIALDITGFVGQTSC
ncbi:uncharacterized protein LOC133745302 isoform X2 [Rosa rugosa]|uniref:uncharacterized protein LOC133707908 isoform X2 n=1 Tax=Rosa rugosa TaxID=74645 RepID=UPI002B405DB0|nr:uncharacterized protein LOC133707908 isoform X2 [Rosa rugosa]XP_061998325.1 uncharacterized protein LOC133715724 isoform X2 [Rosa rugosa]XP_061998840.1 uncharacterized protein LOC133716112 isoform X2 [Rosa rugosa]XP_061998890.1 uncharacterized protein LOC133716183 isoform X1 [Rosa rugosa]XP_062029346.1 uncharacterized protein LOC133745302 isoform X2 [Rosa rugosa]